MSLPRTRLDYCRPFLDAVDAHPGRVAFFIESLVTHMDGSSAGRPFWDVWQAFANWVIKAPMGPLHRFQRFRRSWAGVQYGVRYGVG